MQLVPYYYPQQLLGFVLLGVVGLIVFAQASLATASTVYCPQLVQTLQQGARDAGTSPTGQVTELQKFLASYYGVDQGTLVSGYFGALTQKYTTQFQTEQQLSAYGVVGSQTRAAIQTACGAASITTISGDSGGAMLSASATSGTGLTNASATISASTLTTASLTPTLAGSAYGTDTVVVALGSNDGSSIYGEGPVSVVNHHWSVWLVGLPGYGSATVSPGTYTIIVYDTNHVRLAGGTLLVKDRQVGRAMLPSCSITASPSTVSAGQSATIFWATQNADTARWTSAGGTRGVLAGTTVVPTAAPGLSGSQSVAFPVSGFSSFGLSVHGATGDATCSGYVLVLGSTTATGFGVTAATATSTTSTTTPVTTTPVISTAPSGSLSWSLCTVSGGAAACAVTVNWISSNSVLNGAPQVGISIRNSAGVLAFDESGTLATLPGAGAVNPSYPLSASANGSKTFTLPPGSYSISLLGYNADGSTVVLQTQQVSVQ